MTLYIKHLQPLLLILSISTCLSQKKYAIQTIAFYNLENLFDTINNPNKLDELSPIMESNNNKTYIYKDKLSKLAHVLSKIGLAKNQDIPSIIGVVEVENKQVIQNLLNTSPLDKHKYGIIHFESADQRGIDVALLYNPLIYKPIFNENIPANLYQNNHKMYTRDILHSIGYFFDEKIHIIINHWPSRRGGLKKSNPLREQVAFRLKQIIEKIYTEEIDPKIIIMGDFNDNPNDKSLKNVLKTSSNKLITNQQLYNPFEKLFKQGSHTLTYKGDLFLFDQIIFSKALIGYKNNFKSFKFYKAGIFNPSYMTLQTGKYKGSPKRSFNGSNYLGGYSDHYPVFSYLIKEIH